MPCVLQPMGLYRVGHDLVTEHIRKQNVVHLYDGLLHRHTRNCSDMHYNVDEL